MSRETDNSSSGPHGHSGAAYPSGTPPYGTPAQGDGGDGTGEGRQGAAGTAPAGTAGGPAQGSAGGDGTPAQERRTETTLTTRVRINIPGSRPIPPVVMRTPMSDVNGPEAPASATADGVQGATGVEEATGSVGAPEATAGGAQDPSGTAGRQKEPTSDWFAPPPRKPSGGRAAGPGGATTTGSGTTPGATPGLTGAGDGGSGFATGPATGPDLGATSGGTDFGTGTGTGTGTGLGTSGSGTGGPGAGLGAGATGSGFGSDPDGVPGAGPAASTAAGLPRRRADRGPGAPGGGQSTFDAFGVSGGGFTERAPGGTDTGSFPGPSGPRPAGGIDPGSSAPGTPGVFDTGTRSGLYDLFDTPVAPGTSEAPGAPGAGAPSAGADGEYSSGTIQVPGAAGGPGPDDTGGFDVTGAVASGPAGAGGGPRESDLAFFAQGGRGPQPPGPAGPVGPSGPTGGPVTGDSVLPSRHPERGAAGPAGGAPSPGEPGGVPPRMSDDTAILTPQKPAPEPDPAAGPEDNISGHTVTSGIPVVPSTRQRSPFAASEHPAPQAAPKPQSPKSAPAPAPKKPADAQGQKGAGGRKKGRSKLVLLAVALVVVAGCFYGAGLLVNHSDVPKGSTVLGVDIGGGTRDEAGKKLDAAFGDRTHRTLQLSVDGKTVALQPDQAGLALDADATVQAAAQSDYNPVTVVGSLFGQKRTVQPAMPVDEEKLRAALERAAGGAGSASEGTIQFKPSGAVAVYGKTGKGIDAAASAPVVEEAYRVMVEKGHADPVPVPLTERKPTVSNAEVDRMMKDFAKPAMSGIVTVTAGGRSIQFGPEKSLPQILGVKAVDGKLVDTYDKAAVKRLYGSVFDGVLITRANGKQTPVQPTDVILAMRKPLLGKTAGERVGVIDTDPS